MSEFNLSVCSTYSAISDAELDANVQEFVSLPFHLNQSEEILWRLIESVKPYVSAFPSKQE